MADGGEPVTFLLHGEGRPDSRRSSIGNSQPTIQVYAVVASEACFSISASPSFLELFLFFLIILFLKCGNAGRSQQQCEIGASCGLGQPARRTTPRVRSKKTKRPASAGATADGLRSMGRKNQRTCFHYDIYIYMIYKIVVACTKYESTRFSFAGLASSTKTNIKHRGYRVGISQVRSHKASDDFVQSTNEVNVVSTRWDRGPWAASWHEVSSNIQ